MRLGSAQSLIQEPLSCFSSLWIRRYNKGKKFMIFTSSRKPAGWNDMSAEEIAARCTLDRCIEIDLKGASFRWQSRKVYKVNCSSSPEVTGLDIDKQNSTELKLSRFSLHFMLTSSLHFWLALTSSDMLMTAKYSQKASTLREESRILQSAFSRGRWSWRSIWRRQRQEGP